MDQLKIAPLIEGWRLCVVQTQHVGNLNSIKINFRE